ncbi:MAG TPA: hypothetical protein PKD78_07845, partial [Saprospiraceae bacterium]|nr:hypothetical protein [Saprospiraceae bacterium]
DEPPFGVGCSASDERRDEIGPEADFLTGMGTGQVFTCCRCSTFLRHPAVFENRKGCLPMGENGLFRVAKSTAAFSIAPFLTASRQWQILTQKLRRA